MKNKTNILIKKGNQRYNRKSQDFHKQNNSLKYQLFKKLKNIFLKILNIDKKYIEIALLVIGIFIAYFQYKISESENYYKYKKSAEPLFNIKNEYILYNQKLFNNNSGKIGLSIDIVNSSSDIFILENANLYLNYDKNIGLKYNCKRLFDYNLLNGNIKNLNQVLFQLNPRQSSNINTLFFYENDSGWIKKGKVILFKSKKNFEITKIEFVYKLISPDGEVTEKTISKDKNIKFQLYDEVGSTVYWNRLND
jgi:hypothetical protein